MKLSQKRAIGYAIRERAEKRRTEFILKQEGTLSLFKKSGYKTKLGYIKKKYGVNIY